MNNTGKEAVRAYWLERLQNYPASELDEIQPHRDAAKIVYRAGDSLASAILKFNAAGKIQTLSCGAPN